MGENTKYLKPPRPRLLSTISIKHMRVLPSSWKITEVVCVSPFFNAFRPKVAALSTDVYGRGRIL